MLKKIYEELVLIRKELQAIRSSKEFCKSKIEIDYQKVGKMLHDTLKDNQSFSSKTNYEHKMIHHVNDLL